MTASDTDSKNTQTEAGSETSGKSDSKLDDLYQQENQLFADHADVWNKAFGMMNKSNADPNGNYADYLAGTVESNKDSFTDDEALELSFLLPSDDVFLFSSSAICSSIFRMVSISSLSVLSSSSVNEFLFDSTVPTR